MNFLTLNEGLLLFCTYGLIMIFLTWFFTKQVTSSKEGYFLADRQVSTTLGAVSIASTWIWAGAIFLSSEIAYKWGWPGLFYFSFMNILTLFLFAPFAQQIRNLTPQGFTWSSYLRERFSDRVQTVYLTAFLLFTICVLTFNVFAASKLIEILTGLDFLLGSIMLTVLALAYNFRKGLKATIITEVVKLGLVASTVLIVVPMMFMTTGGWENLIKGTSGISGNYHSLFGTTEAWTLFVTYGLITMFSQWANPWADNSFHQRLFSIPEHKVFKTFCLATVMFAGIPLLIGSIGFMAAGHGINVQGTAMQMINVIAIGQLLPIWALMLFALAAFAAMVSIIDSQLTSLSSLLGHDLHKRLKMTTDTVVFSRWLMVIAGISVIGLVNIPGFTLLYLIMIIAVVRISTLFPSLLSVMRPNWVNETGLFWGMLVGIAVGVPMYAYGAYNKITNLALSGFFTTLIIVPILVLLVSKCKRN